jgi:hypothetical protein
MIDKTKDHVKASFMYLFSTLEIEERLAAEKLYDDFVFMGDVLDELKKDINEKGVIITTTNGNGFSTTKENPAIKQYNASMRSYLNIIKSLLLIMEKHRSRHEGENSNELMDYIMRRHK